jgi:2-iminobutanoate/2-iminopropanoate deaminase
MPEQLGYVNSRAAAAPPQVPFSHAVVDGDYAFVSGCLAADALAAGTNRGGIEGETRAAMDLIGTVLAQLDLDYSDIVRTTVYMTDLDQVAAMNAVYLGYFDRLRPPARTCVEVSRLIEDCLIEIDCIARLRKP